MEGNGHVHRGESYKFVMLGWEEGEVGSNSGCKIVLY